jgi:hypothetical protein
MGRITLTSFFQALLVGCLCLCWSGPALGQASTHPANVKGSRLLKQGNPAAAYYEFRRAYEETGDFRSHYNFGLCHRARQQAAKALCAFDRFLEGADGLEAEKLPPNEQRQVKKMSGYVKAKLLPSLRKNAALLRVTATPQDATILVNGTEVEELPICAERGDTRTVEARLEGYTTASETVTYPDEGDPPPIHLKLVPLPSRLSIQSSVAGARVLIDAEPMGPAPWNGDIEPGEHRVEVLAEGHQPAGQEISLSAGEELSLTLDPTPLAIEREVEPDRRRLSSAWFWSTAALALATGVGAVVTGVLASQRDREFNDYLDAVGAGVAHGTRDEQLLHTENLRDQGQVLTLVTDILWITASASAVATLVLAFFTRFRRNDSSPTIEAGVTLEPGGAFFTACGRF